MFWHFLIPRYVRGSARLVDWHLGVPTHWIRSVLGWGPGAYAKREELLQKDKFDQRQLLHCKARRGEFNTKDGISSATGSGDSLHPGSILGWGCLAYAQREALLQDAKMTMRNCKMS